MGILALNNSQKSQVSNHSIAPSRMDVLNLALAPDISFLLFSFLSLSLLLFLSISD